VLPAHLDDVPDPGLIVGAVSVEREHAVAEVALEVPVETPDQGGVADAKPVQAGRAGVRASAGATGESVARSTMKRIVPQGEA
jgi:hypothetical protein